MTKTETLLDRMRNAVRMATGYQFHKTPREMLGKAFEYTDGETFSIAGTINDIAYLERHGTVTVRVTSASGRIDWTFALHNGQLLQPAATGDFGTLGIHKGTLELAYH